MQELMQTIGSRLVDSQFGSTNDLDLTWPMPLATVYVGAVTILPIVDSGK